MKRQIAVLGAALVAATTLAYVPTTAQAADVDYQLRMVTDQHVISASEIAAGDVTISAAVYFTGSVDNRFGSIKLVYGSDSDNIYFRNIVTGNNATRQNSQVTYESSMGTFTTDYIPYCFGYLMGSQNRYMTGGPMFTTSQWCMDPVDGAELYSAGANKIQFTNRDKELVVCDVTVDENGTGHYSYEYVDRSDGKTYTKNAQIPRYDPTIPAYDASNPDQSLIPGAADRVGWLPGSSQLREGAAFFGTTSDEFPFFYVDIVVEQGTAPGVYTVDFDLDECQMFDINGHAYTFDSLSTSIVVSGSSSSGSSGTGTAGTNIAVTGATMNSAAYYMSHNTSAIQATDFATSILADISYPDASGNTVVQRGVDITSMVDCYGVTPKELYSQMGQGGYYCSENAPLYCDGAILKRSDGTTLTQKILVGVKGDVDLNGKVDITDAYRALQYYAQKSAGNSGVKLYGGNDADLETLAYYLADIDTESKRQGADGGEISITDAYRILQYYANSAAGLTPSWADTAM